jgi:PAS domain S-box-containing protein
MIWPFNTRRKHDETREREILRDLKVLESQHALLEAATQTADAANIVTTSLRARLEESIAQFENTARILNDALVICDLDGHVQAFNPAAERMFGIPARMARDTFVGDLFVSKTRLLDTSDNIWALIEEFGGDDAPDVMGRAANGRTFPIDVNHTRLDRSEDAIILMVLRDMSPCADIKSALKSYRSIFDSTFDCILVIDNDTIVAANPIASDLFGYTVDELLTKSLAELVIDGRERLTSAFRTGDDAVGLKGEVKDHDGREMEVSFTTTTIIWNGRPASLVTIKDTTRIWDNKPEAENMICCFNESYKITFVNASFAKFYSARREKLLGADVRDLMDDNERRTFMMHIKGLTPEKPNRRVQMQTKDDLGVDHYQMWTDHAAFDDDGVEFQRIGRAVSKR